jgi:hypothetical protein
MIEIFTLEDIEINSHILSQWNTTIATIVAQLQKCVPQFDPSQITDEQFRVSATFSEIFTKVGDLELRMRVPRSDWEFAKK